MRLTLANFCLGDLKEAIQMGKNALEVSKSTGHKEYQGNTCRILLFLDFEQGESGKTIEYQEKLLDIFRANGSNANWIEVVYYMNLRIIYSRNKGNYSKSFEYFEKGLEMSKAFGFKEEERAIYCYPLLECMWLLVSSKNLLIVTIQLLKFPKLLGRGASVMARRMPNLVWLITVLDRMRNHFTFSRKLFKSSRKLAG